MNHIALNVLGALSAVALLLTVPGCSGDPGGGTSGGDESGNVDESGGSKSGGSGSKSGGSGSKSGGSGSKSGGSSSKSGDSSSSSDESYGFCFNDVGWSCPTADAKAACVKGSCGLTEMTSSGLGAR